MKKKVMVGLVSVVVAVALVFGGVTFYNNRQQEKFEKQMASYESVDTMQHPSEATTSIDGIQVPLGKKPKVTTKKTTKKSTRIQKLKKKASRSKITTRRTTKRRTTTSQNHSRRKVVNTKVVKTQKDYDKKGSKKRTIKNKYDGYNKAYAIKSASEYFAESYKDYKEHPSALRSKRPRTYQFVKSTIDGITDSDVQNIKDTYGEYWGL